MTYDTNIYTKCIFRRSSNLALYSSKCGILICLKKLYCMHVSVIQNIWKHQVRPTMGLDFVDNFS
jgi:hypothetical protein